MAEERCSHGRIWFYTALGAYLAIGIALNILSLLDVPVVGHLWETYGFYADFVTAVVGFLAAYFLFRALEKTEKGGVERSVLLLAGLTALFFGLGSLLTGIVDSFTADVTFKSSAISFSNIGPAAAFLVAALSALVALAILIRSSYSILSRTQLVVISLVSIMLLAATMVFFYLPITVINLDGAIKGMVHFFSLVCVMSFVGTIFVIMAFGRGRGRGFLRNLVLGIMFLGVSGLGVLFFFSVAERWAGIPLLGFTLGTALLARAGYYRWRLLKR